MILNVQKIIFLDIDGVLCPSLYSQTLHRMWEISAHEIKSQDRFGSLFFYQNVAALKSIIDRTGAKIVLSSTWRMTGLRTIQELWKARDLPGEVMDITPFANEVVNAKLAANYDSSVRGHEIKLWLQRNPGHKYVIIDDDNDMLIDQHANFVQTNGAVGLTQWNASNAVIILNR